MSPNAESATVPEDRERSEIPAKRFAIIAVGASAGGLEAIEAFLREVPVDCEHAFVVIQHLDPSRPALLVELLQSTSRLPVSEVLEHTRVEPGHVYVIPPDRDLSIRQGVLRLRPSARELGVKDPIDRFFRELSEDRGEQAVGVILSGMGTDGTLGLRAIKAHAGATFAQEPAQAKFDSMPRSAIDDGAADVVAPASGLYERIVAVLAHGPLHAPHAIDELPEAELLGLEQIVVQLRAITGHDFSQYKRSTVARRIQRRMGLHGLERSAEYLRFMRDNAEESGLLFRELLIGVTSFFRDPESWAYLATHVLPDLVTSRPNAVVLRVWTAACSTGEEAYSLAIVLLEAIAAAKLPYRLSVQIFATDLDEDAIAVARRGVYLSSIEGDVSAERLEQFFVPTTDGYRVSKTVREMVIFATHNLVMAPPFTRLDLVSCRNLLIYLEPDLQRKLLPLFHYSLRANGVLFLGSAETIGTAGGLFDTLHDKHRLYRRREGAGMYGAATLPSVFRPVMPDRREGSGESSERTLPSLQEVTQSMLRAEYTPAAVLVGAHGDILYVSGATGDYLEPAAGKANWNIFAMARVGLEPELSNTFWQAVRDRRTVVAAPFTLAKDEAAPLVQLTVQPLHAERTEELRLLIVFRVFPPTRGWARHEAAPDTDNQQAELRHAEVLLQLNEAHASLLQARQGMQLSEEALRSSNEELQSANEELQSANEELQSMNEELQTVNHELETKLRELSLASNDMTNLLNSTHIATLFLDKDLNIRRFTTPMAKLIRLVPSDIGRPIGDIVTLIEFPQMVAIAKEVLESLAAVEKEIATDAGRWVAVRIMPYRTHDNRIDGVVLTFNDVTRAKRLEIALRAALEPGAAVPLEPVDSLGSTIHA